jgi:murein DD-endopeptidase MepM/ murein hydrolase activator NlpD
MALLVLMAFSCGKKVPAAPDVRGIPPLLPRAELQELEFRRGDSLDGLLKRAGITARERSSAIEAIACAFDPGHFRAGETLEIGLDSRNSLQTLHYPVNFQSDLCLWREGEGFRARVVLPDLVWEASAVSITMQHSFYEDFEKQGLDGNLATRVADLFAGEIDFLLELRNGDRMDLLLDRTHRPDRDLEKHRVLAARLSIGGRDHEAYLFPDTSGTRHYYHADGSSLDRQFLKAPLSFTRISSGFSRSRMHPILKKRRPHLGIDYAAPAGTPVLATADGTVIRKQRSNSAGRYVKIRHPGKIETTYMHLLRFARGLRQGQKVKKGEVIGYVGSSGLSTGPHLDYRIRVGGKYVDPRSFRSDPARPLPDSRRKLFEEERDNYESTWASIRPPGPLVLASTSKNPSK